MLSKVKFEKLRKSLLFRSIKKARSKALKRNHTYKISNSFFSSLMRIYFRFKLNFQIFYFLNKSSSLKLMDQFWTIHIGFIRKSKFTLFIKIDPYISNNPFCCSNLKNLPLKNESCQMIHIKHFLKYIPNKKYDKILKAWKKKLIPGGILKIQIKFGNNNDKLEKIKISLSKNQFFIKDINYSDLKINGTITITAVKSKIIKPLSDKTSQEKINDILNILKQNENLFFDIRNLCIIGHHIEILAQAIKQLNPYIRAVQNFNSIESLSNISENSFDMAIIANFLEFRNYSDNQKLFNILKQIVKKDSQILLIIPESKNYLTKDVAQLFEKGIIVKILDDNNLNFEWINLSSSFKMIQVLIQNQISFPVNKNNIRVLLLGVYSLRYVSLANARWDSQARAFKKLGYNTQILDIKDNSFNYILKYIKIFKPDILWIGGKVVYDFLIKNADYFRSSSIKIIYWMWDITTFESYDFKDLIDYMFITSKGEVPLYKKKFNLDKVYYMPVAIMPEIIHRNRFIKEVYDVGFAGQLVNTKDYPYYQERRQALQMISKHFKVKIFKRIYNNLPEYYSKCKIIFGGTPALKDLELYASNRPYIALGSGCCFITNYFEGLEKLAKNEQHLLWFNSHEELLNLLKKYIPNHDLREKIRNNAEKLAREKHNYIDRIQNMLNIINGKTEDFYGFIQ